MTPGRMRSRPALQPPDELHRQRGAQVETLRFREGTPQIQPIDGIPKQRDRGGSSLAETTRNVSWLVVGLLDEPQESLGLHLRRDRPSRQRDPEEALEPEPPDIEHRVIEIDDGIDALPSQPDLLAVVRRRLRSRQLSGPDDLKLRDWRNRRGRRLGGPCPARRRTRDDDEDHEPQKAAMSPMPSIPNHGALLVCRVKPAGCCE